MPQTHRLWFYIIAVIVLLALAISSPAQAQSYCVESNVQLFETSTYTLKIVTTPFEPGSWYRQYDWIELVLEVSPGMEVLNHDIRFWNQEIEHVVDIVDSTVTITIETADFNIYGTTYWGEIQFNTFGTVTLDSASIACLGYGDLLYPPNLWTGNDSEVVFDPAWMSCYSTFEDFVSGNGCRFAYDGECDGYQVMGYECPLGACSWYSFVLDEQVCDQRIEFACLADDGVWFGAQSTECSSRLEPSQLIPVEFEAVEMEGEGFPFRRLLEGSTQQTP